MITQATKSMYILSESVAGACVLDSDSGAVAAVDTSHHSHIFRISLLSTRCGEETTSALS